MTVVSAAVMGAPAPAPPAVAGVCRRRSPFIDTGRRGGGRVPAMSGHSGCAAVSPTSHLRGNSPPFFPLRGCPVFLSCSSSRRRYCVACRRRQHAMHFSYRCTQFMECSSSRCGCRRRRVISSNPSLPSATLPASLAGAGSSSARDTRSGTSQVCTPPLPPHGLRADRDSPGSRELAYRLTRDNHDRRATERNYCARDRVTIMTN